MTFIADVVDAVMQAAQRGDRAEVSKLLYGAVSEHMSRCTLGKFRAFMLKRGAVGGGRSSVEMLDEYVNELIGQVQENTR